MILLINQNNTNFAFRLYRGFLIAIKIQRKQV